MISKDQWQLALQLIPSETLNTLYMVGVAAFFSFLIGLPLGILLWMSRPRGIWEKPSLYRSLSVLVNIGRSIPFAILMVAIIPFTRWLVGTSIGTTASIVPLSLAGIPFVARYMEGIFLQLNPSIIEAAEVMGSTHGQLIGKVVLPEVFPALISCLRITLVNLVGYSAMAGLIGGGGLGKIAIHYGYQRFNGFLMAATLLVLLGLVEAIEWGGRALSRYCEKKRGKI